MPRKYAHLPPEVARYIPALVEMVRRLAKAPPGRVDVYAELSEPLGINARHVQRLYLREKDAQPRTVPQESNGRGAEAAGSDAGADEGRNTPPSRAGDNGGGAAQWREIPPGTVVRPAFSIFSTVYLCGHGRLHDADESCGCDDG